jgi:hypothetical protein
MKNVAATNGHSVNFAELLFAGENPCAGTWFCGDAVLNFLAFSFSSACLSRGAKQAQPQNTVFLTSCNN